MGVRDEEKALKLKQALEARTYWLERAAASKTKQEWRGCIAQATHVDTVIRRLDPTHKLRSAAAADPNATPGVLGTSKRVDPATLKGK